MLFPGIFYVEKRHDFYLFDSDGHPSAYPFALGTFPFWAEPKI